MKKYIIIYHHFQKYKLIFQKIKELIIVILIQLVYQLERHILGMILLQKEAVILKMNLYQNKNL